MKWLTRLMDAFLEGRLGIVVLVLWFAILLLLLFPETSR